VLQPLTLFEQPSKWATWATGKTTDESSEPQNEKRKKLDAGAPAIGDRLLTLREAAEALRLSTRTVREILAARRDRGANNWWPLEIQACSVIFQDLSTT
jgi:hypothetical protein